MTYVSYFFKDFGKKLWDNGEYAKALTRKKDMLYFFLLYYCVSVLLFASSGFYISYGSMGM